MATDTAKPGRPPTPSNAAAETRQEQHVKLSRDGATDRVYKSSMSGCQGAGPQTSYKGTLTTHAHMHSARRVTKHRSSIASYQKKGGGHDPDTQEGKRALCRASSKQSGSTDKPETQQRRHAKRDRTRAAVPLGQCAVACAVPRRAAQPESPATMPAASHLMPNIS